jgi:purine-cytosine permease-like protein
MLFNGSLPLFHYFFFWLITILIYTKYNENSTASVIDFAIFIPFLIIIVYIIIFLFHLYLPRAVIDRITNHLNLMLKISLTISTLASFAQITMDILFLGTADKVQAKSYASVVTLILGVFIVQELCGAYRQ